MFYHLETLQNSRLFEKVHHRRKRHSCCRPRAHWAAPRRGSAAASWSGPTWSSGRPPTWSGPTCDRGARIRSCTRVLNVCAVSWELPRRTWSPHEPHGGDDDVGGRDQALVGPHVCPAGQRLSASATSATMAEPVLLQVSAPGGFGARTADAAPLPRRTRGLALGREVEVSAVASCRRCPPVCVYGYHSHGCAGCGGEPPPRAQSPGIERSWAAPESTSGPEPGRSPPPRRRQGGGTKRGRWLQPRHRRLGRSGKSDEILEGQGYLK